MKDKDIVFGFVVGYDFFIGGNVFVGVEGSVDGSKVKVCEIGMIIIIGIVVVFYEICVKLGWDLFVVVWVGMYIGDWSKIYVFGGYINVWIKIVIEVELVFGVLVCLFFYVNGDGFWVGLGLEYKFFLYFFGKIEYWYFNYEGGFDWYNGFVVVGFIF